MTPEEYIKREKKFYQWLTTKGKPFEISVYNVVALQAVRIFEDGKKSDGNLIGQYDTTSPLYANPKNYKGGGKFKPLKGKTGKSKFKDGTPHVTRWFNNYKELRNTLGRRIDKVNLQLNYDLFSDFINAPKGSKKGKVKPTKINNFEFVTKFSREINALKRKGLEDKYGNIFKLTKKEIEAFLKTLDFNIRKARYDFYVEYGKPTMEMPPKTSS